MSVIYQTNMATSDGQDVGNALLSQIKDSVALLAGTTEPAELSALNQILTALASQATAANQAALATIVNSILSGMATGANQTAEIAAINAMSAKLAGGNSSVITSVTQSPSSQSALATNASRKGLYLYNDSGAKCYVAFAASASQTAFSFVLAPNSGYESPQAKVYTGAISVIWASGTSGALRITEIT
jgi:hypothetical protein